MNFISCGSGGIVDISNITAVVLDIDTDFAITDDSVADAGGYQLALDLRVDQLETTVPVPAPIALLGMGLLAGGYFSRRKPKG